MIFISRIIYNVVIGIYQFIALLISPINEKAANWTNGRKYVFEELQKLKGQQSIWIHCASLGEFEQARPVIDLLKKAQPNFPVVITFFSPSGYEIIKQKNEYDNVFYLPIDTQGNAKCFIELVNPAVTIFVRYEFWYHYLTQLKQRNIPLILISAVFREKDIFFKSFGMLFREMLECFTHIFVQDKQSLAVLNAHGWKCVTKSGDTRFDRVVALRKERRDLPIIKKFVGSDNVLIFGSIEPGELDLICEIINNTKGKFIVAPHDIGENFIERIQGKINKPTIVYSQIETSKGGEPVLIIDNIGLLSSTYRYCNIAYIGGGFDKGIHNILEAAVYGLPVIFGLKYQKFNEANELIKAGAAFPINNYQECTEVLQKLIDEVSFAEQAGESAQQYVLENTGASKLVVEYVNQVIMSNSNVE